jgi:cytochrome c-type biogenesis protein CcsB
VSESLAQTSNNLVYAAMAIYACALLAFAWSLAAGRGRDLDAVRTSTKVRAGAGAAAMSSASGSVATLTRPGGNDTETSADEEPITPTVLTTTSVQATATAPDRVTRPVGTVPPDAPLPPGRRAGNIGMALMWLATMLLLGGVIIRGFAVGRPPWGNMYEFSTAFSLAVGLAFLAVSLKRDVRWLGVFVVLPVLATLGLAVTVLYTAAEQLVPALNSYWLAIHVPMAIICSGALCVAAVITILFLVADSSERRIAAGKSYWLAALAERIPESKRLDALSYRMTAFLFPLWTFAVIAGAIWAENAWGRYWGWDPKETWAFITWVAYAAYLHARATAGWKGRKAAYLGLIAFGCFLFNYYGVNIFFSSLHSYAGVG